MTVVKQRGEIVRALSRWDPAIRLLLLAGTDESGTRDLAAVAAKALADPADAMSVTDLTPEELKSDPGRLADEAASISMFGGRKLIRVTVSTTAAADAVTDAAKLLLDTPAAGNPVLMIAGDLSKTNSLRKLAEDSPAAIVHISWPLSGDDAARWLQSAAQDLGLRLESGVGQRLLHAGGGDSGIIMRELEKFALYLGAAPETPQRLERSHVAALGADSAEEDMSALVRAVVLGDRRGLERQLQLLAGSSPIPALRAVARRLIQFAEARAAVDAGSSPAAALKALRPPIFYKEVDAMADALRQWPQARITAGLAAMFAGERAIKQPGSAGDTLGWHAILLLGAGPENA